MLGHKRPALDITVHIGAPKAGSTAIQRAMFEGRSELLANGVLYPDICLRGFGHHDLAFLLAGGYPQWATPQPLLLNDLHEQARQLNLDGLRQVSLSSENFYLYPAPARLKAFFEDALGDRAALRWRVICLLRPQEESVVSWYNQAVKAQGFSGTFAESQAHQADQWCYEKALAPWADTFGDSAICVLKYEAQGRVRAAQAAAAALGLGDVGSLQHEATNTRINRDVLEFQRLINELPLSAEERRRFHRELIALTTATAGRGLFSDAPVAGSSELSALRARYERSNRAVAQRFLGQDALFAPFSAPSDEPERQPSDYALSQASALRILGWILARAR
jgi:hypothetical protein